MEPQPQLTTDIILNDSRKLVGTLHLPDNPQPGAVVTLHGQTYTVLERRHRYWLRSGQYRLHRIALYVQVVSSSERSLVNGRWVLGDATCRYNAQSELIRCAVNPAGPCHDCPQREPRLD